MSIQKYQKARDELTFREDSNPDESEEIDDAEEEDNSDLSKEFE